MITENFREQFNIVNGMQEHTASKIKGQKVNLKNVGLKQNQKNIRKLVKNIFMYLLTICIPLRMNY